MLSYYVRYSFFPFFLFNIDGSSTDPPAYSVAGVFGIYTPNLLDDKFPEAKHDGEEIR